VRSGGSWDTEDATFAFPCVKDLLGRDCSSVEHYTPYPLTPQHPPLPCQWHCFASFFKDKKPLQIIFTAYISHFPCVIKKKSFSSN